MEGRIWGLEKTKDLKYSYPVPLADYSETNNLQEEPALAWCVPYTLKKRISIIRKIKADFWRKTHKYWIQIPRNVKEAKGIDIKNGNKLWEESWVMEMTNTRYAFEKYEENTSELNPYNEPLIMNILKMSTQRSTTWTRQTQHNLATQIHIKGWN